jgi:hypothetical protein
VAQGAAAAKPAAVETASRLAEAPPHRPWEWSMAEAWTWLGHAWRTLIQMPYLGLMSLVLAALLVIILFARLLAPR